jgi:hypothetical protein
MHTAPALFALLFLAACGGAPKSSPSTDDAPGVKPMYVACDPDRPEMPCTPDAPVAPPADPRPGVKPDYVACDPDRPEMPCTPDTMPAPPPEAP